MTEEEKLDTGAELEETDDARGEAAEEAEGDYEEMIEEELAALRAAVPELAGIREITDLQNPTRYGALRDLGLSPEEAYRATTLRQPRGDNRAHLRTSAPRYAAAPAGSMPYAEMQAARELLGVSDAELQRLYKKVTK